MNLVNTQHYARPDLQLHLYSDALISNVKQLKSLCDPSVKFCAVVKANAYGHGMTEIVNILKNTDVDFFAVASVFEALHIKPLVKNQAILILEPINSFHDSQHIILSAKNNFHCAIASTEAAKHVSNVLSDTDYKLKLHVNVETGMGRCGLDTENAKNLIRQIDDSQNTELAGIYTHFATADEDDLSYAYQQLDCFNEFLSKNNLTDRDDTIIHAANSAAAIKIPQSHFDMIRCGIATYGYFSRPQKNPSIQLKPVMKLQAPIVQIKKIAKAKPVSYGRSFITSRDTTLGVVPLGYADGYWRCFSNKAVMKFTDVYVPVIGRVSMDQSLVDITDVNNASLGQMVTVIDNQHDSPCSAYALADLADTICYEILTCVHAHVTRIVH